jgi:TldD protein
LTVTTESPRASGPSGDTWRDPLWRSRLEPLLAAGRAAGADLVEVFLERTDHLGVLAEQEAITSVSPAFGMGAGLRVFLGERDGFVRAPTT